MLETCVDFKVGIVLFIWVCEINVEFKVGIVLSFWLLLINVEFKVGLVLFIWFLENNVDFWFVYVVLSFEVDVDSELVSSGTSYFTIFSPDILIKSNLGTSFISQVLAIK